MEELHDDTPNHSKDSNGTLHFSRIIVIRAES